MHSHMQYQESGKSKFSRTYFMQSYICLLTDHFCLPSHVNIIIFDKFWLPNI